MIDKNNKQIDFRNLMLENYPQISFIIYQKLLSLEINIHNFYDIKNIYYKSIPIIYNIINWKESYNELLILAWCNKYKNDDESLYDYLFRIGYINQNISILNFTNSEYHNLRFNIMKKFKDELEEFNKFIIREEKLKRILND